MVAPGDVAGGFDQLRQVGFMANQRLEYLGDVLEWVNRSAVDLQFSNGHFAVHQQRLPGGGGWHRHLGGRRGRSVGIGGQVGHRKVTDGVVAVEEAG